MGSKHDCNAGPKFGAKPEIAANWNQVWNAGFTYRVHTQDSLAKPVKDWAVELAKELEKLGISLIAASL